MKRNQDGKSKVFQAIFYLSPGDYHRFHCPADVTFKRRNHITGYLDPVKPSYVKNRPDVYQKNERVALFGEWEHGFLTYVCVGALNVGSIEFNFDKKLKTNEKLHNPKEGKNISVFDYTKMASFDIFAPVLQKQEAAKNCPESEKGVLIAKGEEVGRFNLGSTIILIFEAPEDFLWNVKPGDKVRYGQSIGYIPPDENNQVAC
eukprot:TRINITY_DN5554_c0_g2_i1.p1 TRINITY_DN5554_c0_g2~~TRINITY_DN5554_c0_g2_i1.p1  ORF type:complete len:203 (-),score=40.36 TRINITY_DN5554_c0_g2_i1:123-731(-)